MGQLLLLLEALTASLLLAALLLACFSRIRHTLPRRLMLGFIFLLAAAPWVLASGALVYSGSSYSLYRTKAFVLGSLTAALLVGLVILYRRALRKSELEPAVRAACGWHRGKLALTWLASLAVTAMTYWNLDMAARQELSKVQMEAVTIALSLAPPNIPDSQNAAILYQRAMEMMGTDRHWDDRITDWLNPPSPDDTPDSPPPAFDPTNPQMREFLNEHRQVLSLLRHAGEMPACNFSVNYAAPFDGVIRSRLEKSRSLAKLLLASALVNAHDRQLDEAMKDLSAVFAMSSHISTDPTIISWLMSVAIDSQAVEAAQQILLKGPVTEAVLGQLKLDEFVSFHDRLARSLTVWQAFILYNLADFSSTLIQTEDPFVSNMIAPQGSVFRIFFAREELADCRAPMQREIESASVFSYAEAKEKWKSFDKSSAAPKGIFRSILVGSFHRAIQLSFRADAKHRACLLGVAMYRYRAKYGKYPEHFEQLTPEFLVTVPVDPFDGKPMRLNKSDKGWVIYSVGADLVDDQGSVFNDQPEKGDIAFRMAAP